MFANLTKKDIQKRGLVRDGYTLPYNPLGTHKAKILRKNMTQAEKKLWYCFLKNHRYKFYRQKPIDHFIVDFYCANKKLVIEVDWAIHNTKQSQEYDTMRTEILALYNVQVIRFRNKDILYNFDRVCRYIEKVVSSL